MEKKCQKCGKEINKDEESIYNGMCEKCYNKWINKKDPNHVKRKNSDESFKLKGNTFSTIALIMGLMSFGFCGMAFILGLTFSPAIILSLIFSGFKTSSEFNWVIITIKSTAAFSTISFAINTFALLNEKNNETKTGFILACISIIFSASFGFF